VTRRDILKYCAVAGGGFLISTRGPVSRTFASAPQSPPTEPFLDPLPVPPEPAASFQAFTDLSADARRFVDPTKGAAKFYTIVAENRSVQFHSQLPPTPIWGYRDGSIQTPWNFVAGPTFRAKLNGNLFAGNIVRVVNNLHKNDTGFGIPRLTTHLHGGHHPASCDGFPDNVNGVGFEPVIEPDGGHYDYAFPLQDPGFSTNEADPTERPSFLWYHDHILDFTGPNVYRGLAGLHPVFEDAGALGKSALDLDNEDDDRGLCLPSGEFDVPMVVQDKLFAPDGSLVFNSFDHNGFLGDKFLMNGAIQPHLNVKARRYRIRLLNGSNARHYQPFLTNADGKTFPMTVIATEGGLLSRPVQVESFMLPPALRFEVIVDFSMFKPGDKVYLENRLSQDDGRGPNGTFENPELLRAGVRLMEFRVGEKVPDPSLDVTKPGVTLRPFQKVSDADLRSAVYREFEFSRSEGAWTVNGQLVDINRPMAKPRLNQPEIWRLKNSSGGWWHPVHIHSEFSRVLSRNGVSPSPYVLERDGIARKDTIVLGPGSDVEIFFRFRDFTGPFVFHCHNIEHEDMAMMARFDVVS
jgi:FtsP/CotA-like multicopper oxidase with cupredoxin domain